MPALFLFTTKPRPSTRKTLKNRIRSAFENNVEQEFVDRSIRNLVQPGILELTESDKINYKAA